MPLAARARRRLTAVPAAALAGAMLVAGATGCGAGAAPRSVAPLVLAADLALTGSGSPVGTVYRQALELRVEQLNRQRAATGLRIELRIRDNRSDPATAEANLAEFAADSTVSAVVAGGCTACVVEAAPALDAAGLPTLALVDGDAVAEPASQRRYIFQLAPPAGETADLLAVELGRAETTRFALVSVDDGSGAVADGVREMSAAARAAGLELVLHERLTPDQFAGADPEPVAAVAARVAGWQPAPPPLDLPAPAPGGPEAVVLWAPAAEAGTLAVALRQADWSGRLFLAAPAAGSLSLTGPLESALAGARLVFTEILAIDDVIATSPARAARQLWWRDYVARYGDYDAFASFAADAVDLVAAAVERAGGADRRLVRDELAAAHVDGLTGPIRFGPEDHSGLQPLALTVLVASGGRWRPAR